MKKIALILIACFLSLVCFTGCTSVGKNFFGIVKGVVIQDDYEAAGRMVGEAGYMAYVIMKGDPKYDKYTAKAEEIYAALDNAEGFDTTSMNQVILEIMQAALTAKYGYVKATLITDGIRIGGVIADRLILKDVSAADATLYVKGLKEGIDEARGKTPAIALDEAEAKRQEKLAKEKAKQEGKEKEKEEQEKDEWAKPVYITCAPVKTCTFTFSNRTMDVQYRIAKELDVFGFLDPNEQPTEEKPVTKYKNVQDFIKRCELLQKYSVQKVNVWISYVKVSCDWEKDENGNDKLDKEGNKIAKCVLEEIKFLWEDDYGNVLESTCVGCQMFTELDDLIRLLDSSTF